MNTADHDAILLVGEGDFSFSVALEQHLVGVDITTSCLLTEADLYKRHTNSRTNVSLLKEQGTYHLCHIYIYNIYIYIYVCFFYSFKQINVFLFIFYFF